MKSGKRYKKRQVSALRDSGTVLEFVLSVDRQDYIKGIIIRACRVI